MPLDVLIMYLDYRGSYKGGLVMVYCQNGGYIIFIITVQVCILNFYYRCLIFSCITIEKHGADSL